MTLQPKKRVLLVNPAKDDGFAVTRIHAGLCILGGILKTAGHEVRVYDYAYLRHLSRNIRIPTIRDLVREYEPDVIGISVFTYVFDECQQMIAELSVLTNAPIILGGPHFSIFPDDLGSDSRITAVVHGEAEKNILDIVNHITKSDGRPVSVKCDPPQGNEIPTLNLDVAYGHEYLNDYQIQLSRGCPYHCSFCSVKDVAGHNIRKRDVFKCVDEIADAKSRYPSIRSVAITDDCPTADMSRFKVFLREMTRRNLGLTLWVDNVRANLLDEETIALYKAAGGRNLCLGVESGNRDVFSLVNKGETLADIERAAGLITDAGIDFGMCFVIGLPEDTLERHKDSVRLAKKLRPDYVFWNMCVPWPGTAIRKWFEKNGEVGEIRNFSTLIDPRVNFKEPVASSCGFSRRDRIKAWLGANMETHSYFRNPRDIGKMLALTVKYRLYRSFIVYLAHSFVPGFLEYLRFLPGGVFRKTIRLFGNKNE